MITKIYENEPANSAGAKSGQGTSPHELQPPGAFPLYQSTGAAAKSGSPFAAQDQVLSSMDVRMPMGGKESNRNMQDSLLESVDGPHTHSKMLVETHRAAGLEQLDPQTELKASRMEMFNKLQSSSISAPKDGDFHSFKGGTTAALSKHGPEDLVVAAPHANENIAMSQLKAERYLKRAQVILESAWLIT